MVEGFTSTALSNCKPIGKVSKTSDLLLSSCSLELLTFISDSLFVVSSLFDFSMIVCVKFGSSIKSMLLALGSTSKREPINKNFSLGFSSSSSKSEPIGKSSDVSSFATSSSSKREPVGVSSEISCKELICSSDTTMGTESTFGSLSNKLSTTGNDGASMDGQSSVVCKSFCSTRSKLIKEVSSPSGGLGTTQLVDLRKHAVCQLFARLTHMIVFEVHHQKETQLLFARLTHMIVFVVHHQKETQLVISVTCLSVVCTFDSQIRSNGKSRKCLSLCSLVQVIVFEVHHQKETQSVDLRKHFVCQLFASLVQVIVFEVHHQKETQLVNPQEHFCQCLTLSMIVFGLSSKRDPMVISNIFAFVCKFGSSSSSKRDPIGKSSGTFLSVACTFDSHDCICGSSSKRDPIGGSSVTCFSVACSFGSYDLTLDSLSKRVSTSEETTRISLYFVLNN
ncbi:hypothetical protein BLOT_010973, partial [Blomia tropicalis]